MDDHVRSLARARSLLGEMLVVRNYYDASVHERQIIDVHLDDITRLPMHLVERLIGAGLRNVILGAGPPTEPFDFSYLGDSAPLKTGAVVYERVQRVIVMGTLGDDALRAHDMLHEFGHAAGHLLELNDHPMLIEHHRDLHVWMRLPTYYRGIRPGDERGRREFLAEAVRDRIPLGDASASRRYGRTFMQWLNSELEIR